MLRFQSNVEFVQIGLFGVDSVFGEKIIKYIDIEQREVIDTTRVSQQNLLIKIKGKKIVISNMTDTENYEILRHRLKTNCAGLENV